MAPLVDPTPPDARGGAIGEPNPDVFNPDRAADVDGEDWRQFHHLTSVEKADGLGAGSHGVSFSGITAGGRQH